MGREIRRKAQCLVDVAGVPGGLCLAVSCFSCSAKPAARHSRPRPIFPAPVVVGRAQIGIAGRIETLRLEEQLAEQEAALRRLRIIGEVGQREPVPACGPLVVGRQLAPLGLRMIMLRQVAQVRLQLRDQLRMVGGIAPLPERRIEAIGRHVLLLGLQHEARELAARIGIDRGLLQTGRLRIDRIVGHECRVAFGGVPEALLVQIEIAQCAYSR